MAFPVALIIGAGPNIAQHTAAALSARGWRVALASRSAPDPPSTASAPDGHLRLRLDSADAAAVQPAFDTVAAALGAQPSLVVYNSAARTTLSATDPVGSLDLSAAQHDTSVNVLGALAAAQAAVRGFSSLPASARKTFVLTGNKLNVMPRAAVLSFGMGKTAAWHMVAGLAGVPEYKAKGYRFYWADQRTPEGDAAANAVDGPAHAELYVRLAEAEGQLPWNHTFVKGKGYVDFWQAD